MRERKICISSPHENAWLRQFPQGKAEWDGHKFFFNDHMGECDYIVAYDDLHAPIQSLKPSAKLIHIATEPPTYHRYDDVFLNQFDWVVTQQPNKTHAGQILTHGALTWYVGWTPEQRNDLGMSFEEVSELFEQPKTKLLSVISSDKVFTEDHRKRLEFAKKLKKHFGDEIDFYGRGFTEMPDKLTALRDHRFHIVIENSSLPDYFSEKFSDCVLAGCYPIYHGCKNITDYFPRGAMTEIDINDWDACLEAIKTTLSEHLDIKHRSALREARDLILHHHNLYPHLIEILSQIEAGQHGRGHKPFRRNGTAFPFRHPGFPSGFASRNGLRALSWLSNTIRSR